MPWRNITRPEILLVTSRETQRWILPKGWPIRGLSGSAVAAQEAYEEAGIKGHIARSAMGSYYYSKQYLRAPPKLCHVHIFALEVTGLLIHWPETQERVRQWFTLDEAAAALDTPDFTPAMIDFFQNIASAQTGLLKQSQAA